MGQLCGCGCGQFAVYPGAKFVHGHHLRLKVYQRKPRPIEPKVCLECQSIYNPNRKHYKISKFCSQKCSQAHRTIRARNCLNCGNRFIPRNGRSVNCTRACRVEWQLKQGKPGSYQYNAWKKFERRCYDCGYNACPRAILIHHIDGNRKNGQISNLVPLCPTCHVLRHIAMNGSAKVPTFRG